MVSFGVGAGARVAGSRKHNVQAAIVASGDAVPATRAVGCGGVQHFFELGSGLLRHLPTSFQEERESPN